ncbi:MAG: hypothetical protein JO297_10895 [Nitrososphaeraceae archaeon]|nr:hypothetical protein [Nitrososphaeraceae archaeon]
MTIDVTTMQGSPITLESSKTGWKKKIESLRNTSLQQCVAFDPRNIIQTKLLR